MAAAVVASTVAADMAVADTGKRSSTNHLLTHEEAAAGFIPQPLFFGIESDEPVVLGQPAFGQLRGLVDLVKGLYRIEDRLHLAGLELLVEDSIEIKVPDLAAAS